MALSSVKVMVKRILYSAKIPGKSIGREIIVIMMFIHKILALQSELQNYITL